MHTPPQLKYKAHEVVTVAIETMLKATKFGTFSWPEGAWIILASKINHVIQKPPSVNKDTLHYQAAKIVKIWMWRFDFI